MAGAEILLLVCGGVFFVAVVLVAALLLLNNNKASQNKPAQPAQPAQPVQPVQPAQPGSPGGSGGDGGAFGLTKYWIPIEGQMDMGDWLPSEGGSYKEERKLNGGARNKQMWVCKGGQCGSGKEKGPVVDYHMFTKCNEEGSCVVGGKLYNLYTDALEPINNPDASKVVFYKPPNAVWGVGNKGNALVPFVSVAVNQNQFPYGTKLRIPALQGKRMPTGVVHNGCVRADDVGPRIGTNKIDFFVGKYEWKKALDGTGVGDGQYTVNRDDRCAFPPTYKTGRP